MITGAAVSSDTSVPTVRTSIREEGDVYALFSDTIIHSCVKAKNRMRGQAFLRNVVSVCQSARVSDCPHQMLFQAAHNLTWLFATLHHCLEHTRSCVGEDHKIGFLGISEYTVRLNGKWHTITSSWKVPKMKNFICQSL